MLKLQKLFISMLSVFRHSQHWLVSVSRFAFDGVVMNVQISERVDDSKYRPGDVNAHCRSCGTWDWAAKGCLDFELVQASFFPDESSLHTY